METLNIIGKVILLKMDYDFNSKRTRRVFADKLLAQTLGLFLNEGIVTKDNYTFTFYNTRAFEAISALDVH